MSYVFRKIKKYVINLLEVFAFNRYYKYISVSVSVILFILTWTNLFGVAANFINSFICFTWIIGWLYEIHKLNKENELLRSVNDSLSNYEAEDVREGLASLMHDIWANGHLYRVPVITKNKQGQEVIINYCSGNFITVPSQIKI